MRCPKVLVARDGEDHRLAAWERHRDSRLSWHDGKVGSRASSKDSTQDRKRLIPAVDFDHHSHDDEFAEEPVQLGKHLLVGEGFGRHLASSSPPAADLTAAPSRRAL